jgi:hypothetical protein
MVVSGNQLHCYMHSESGSTAQPLATGLLLFGNCQWVPLPVESLTGRLWMPELIESLLRQLECVPCGYHDLSFGVASAARDSLNGSGDDPTLSGSSDMPTPVPLPVAVGAAASAGKLVIADALARVEQAWHASCRHSVRGVPVTKGSTSASVVPVDDYN